VPDAGGPSQRPKDVRLFSGVILAVILGHVGVTCWIATGSAPDNPINSGEVRQECLFTVAETAAVTVTAGHAGRGLRHRRQQWLPRRGRRHHRDPVEITAAGGFEFLAQTFKPGDTGFASTGTHHVEPHAGPRRFSAVGRWPHGTVPRHRLVRRRRGRGITRPRQRAYVGWLTR
jgi:hypothetical protein